MAPLIQFRGQGQQDDATRFTTSKWFSMSCPCKKLPLHRRCRVVVNVVAATTGSAARFTRSSGLYCLVGNAETYAKHCCPKRVQRCAVHGQPTSGARERRNDARVAPARLAPDSPQVSLLQANTVAVTGTGLRPFTPGPTGGTLRSLQGIVWTAWPHATSRHDVRSQDGVADLRGCCAGRRRRRGGCPPRTELRGNRRRADKPARSGGHARDDAEGARRPEARARDRGPGGGGAPAAEDGAEEGVDAVTIIDLLDSEDWWAPFRARGAALVTAGRTLAARVDKGGKRMPLPDVAMLQRAHTAGVASGVLIGDSALIVALVPVGAAPGRFDLPRAGDAARRAGSPEGDWCAGHVIRRHAADFGGGQR